MFVGRFGAFVVFWGHFMVVLGAQGVNLGCLGGIWSEFGVFGSILGCLGVNFGVFGGDFGGHQV